MKTWGVLSDATPVTSVTDLQARLLGQRGVVAADELQFFTPTYAESIGNPFSIVGMTEAVERLLHAAKKNERVLVWGDYDADGVSGTAIVLQALAAVGIEAAPYLPHRSEEGYGLNLPALERLIDTFDILITVDCGGSNTEEIEWVASHKKDVIVVDHHELPEELPAARAVLHPRHPEGAYTTTHLSGAGVAWKLAQALLRRIPANDDAEKWLLDLPLIGTLADSMPLMKENRAIVHFGLEVLRRTRRAGLRALMTTARIEGNINAESVIFRIIPALNAAGRMDHPQAALDVLLARTPAAATKAALYLQQLNNERRKLTARIIREAEEHYDPALPVVFAYNAKWPAGVVGIVAGQLASRFHKPAVVIGGSKNHAVGSARSSGNIDVYAALQQARAYTVKLGGHKQAAGFSLLADQVEDFRKKVTESVPPAAEEDTREHTADAVITSELLGWDAYELIQRFEPFGEGNREPTFILRNVTATAIRPVGKEGKHIKLRLLSDTGEMEAIGFGLGERKVEEGARVDVIGQLKLNSFNGHASLQFQLTDIVRSGTVKITSNNGNSSH